MMGHYEIAADVPGRLRVRLTSESEGHGALADVAEALRAANAVRGVRTSGMTRSLVVSYDPDATGVHELVGLLVERGYAPGDEHGRTGRHALTLPTSRVVSAIENSSCRVRQLEDPGLVVPVALSVLSARQLLSHGLQLHKAPWYTFAWYAYSLYRSRQGVSEA